MVNEERKRFITETFNTVASGYDNPALSFFPLTAAQLPQLFSFQGHEYVLDAATGTGTAALNLAVALPQGNVAAVDMSEGMLVQAKKKAHQKGIENVQFSLMDIENLAFAENTFDHINCSFGMFFLEDMEGLIKQFVDKLKPGGKFVSCCFTLDSFQPNANLFYERIGRFGVEVPKDMGFKRLDDEKKSTALYETADLQNIKTHRIDVSFSHENAEQWWDVVWFAGFRGFVEQLDENSLAQFKGEHLHEISELSTENGIPFKVEVIFTVGEKLKY